MGGGLSKKAKGGGGYGFVRGVPPPQSLNKTQPSRHRKVSTMAKIRVFCIILGTQGLVTLYSRVIAGVLATFGIENGKRPVDTVLWAH